MFKKLLVSYLLMVMTVVGTGALPSAVAGASQVQTTAIQVADAIPGAPATAAAASQAEAVQLTAAQMSAAEGDGIWGWLKKIWKKHKKTIIKIIFEIIKIIVETQVSESAQQVEGINGEVVEYHEGTEETQNVYNSEADYNVGAVASSSYYDSGYSYAGADYSNGYVEY
jgi:hypothetical protein